MKKILLIGLLFISLSAYSNEIVEDYFDIASNFVGVGNYQQAIVYLNKILTIESNNKNIIDLKNALMQINKGVNNSFITQKSPSVRKALLAKKNGDKTLQLESLTSGNDYWAYYYLGEYYQQNRKYQSAIDAFTKTLNSKSSLSHCYLKIAQCYFELKNYNQTIMYINQYLKYMPRDDYAYYLRAYAYNNLNSFDLALNDIKTATAINNSCENKYLQGIIFFNMKHYQQAKNKLSSIEKDIQTAEIYKYIGLCEYELENFAEALIYFEKSLLLSDDDINLKNKYNELKIRMNK